METRLAESTRILEKYPDIKKIGRILSLKFENILKIVETLA